MSADKVGELIAALKEQGVVKGEEEARRIVADAKEQARTLLEGAKAEAEGLLSKAREEAKLKHLQLQSSLEIAANQFLAQLKKDLENDLLVLPLGGAVSGAMADPEVLRRLMKSCVEAFAAAGGGHDLALLLPTGAQEDLKKYALSLLAAQTKGGGAPVAVADDLKRGFALSLDGGRSRIEFSDQAFADLFLRYLSPWFRGLFRQGAGGAADKA